MSSRAAWFILAAALACGFAQINWDHVLAEGARHRARQSGQPPGADARPGAGPEPKLHNEDDEEHHRLRKAE